MSDLIQLDLLVPEEQAETVSEELSGYLFLRAKHGWEEDLEPRNGIVRFRVHFENRPLAAEVAEEVRSRWPGVRVEAADVESQNWANAWRDFFTPVVILDTFEVLPPWLAKHADPDRAAIIIDPNMAFGTGHHPTTALCLEVVATLLAEGGLAGGMSFLDLGTGTGILGIGCAKKGLHGLGLDIDPQAISCARENIEVNGVAGSFSVEVGSIEAAPEGETYDLVLANILAEPLMDLAPEIVARVKPGGRLVLSGILAIQADRVEAVYRGLGLPAPRRMVSGEWAALAW